MRGHGVWLLGVCRDDVNKDDVNKGDVNKDLQYVRGVINNRCDIHSKTLHSKP
jgi:hypothetical protein